jgi:ABC-type thiamin/hydroxymethylpyrimidine transport system permease subunit
VLAVVFLVIAGLYYEGVLQIFVSDPHAAHHTTHTILFGVLAIASLIAANFARSRKAA